jgi:hypothetical protein
MLMIFSEGFSADRGVIANNLTRLGVTRKARSKEKFSLRVVTLFLRPSCVTLLGGSVGSQLFVQQGLWLDLHSMSFLGMDILYLDSFSTRNDGRVSK